MPPGLVYVEDSSQLLEGVHDLRLQLLGPEAERMHRAAVPEVLVTTTGSGVAPSETLHLSYYPESRLL